MGMETDFQIKTDDGLTLYGHEWSVQSPKGVVFLIHGLGEHCRRYNHVASALNATGLSVRSIDLRGHGQSEGRRGHAPTYSVLMNDIDRLVETARAYSPNLPSFLYGHSLGANLAIHYALTSKRKFHGLIASAPLFQLAYTPPRLKMTLLRVLKLLRINLSLSSGLDDTALSQDLNVVRSYRNDPLTHHRITPSLATNMLRAGKWNLQHAAELSCPLLLIHGSADRITSVEASKRFFRDTPDCTLKICHGLFHEVHNSSQKDEILAFLSDWIDCHL